jgi:hypothetical protein
MRHSLQPFGITSVVVSLCSHKVPPHLGTAVRCRHGSDCARRSIRKSADPLCRRHQSLTNVTATWLHRCGCLGAAQNSGASSDHRPVPCITAKCSAAASPINCGPLFVQIQLLPADRCVLDIHMRRNTGTNHLISRTRFFIDLQAIRLLTVLG